MPPRHDRNKRYAWHAPEVECIAKGQMPRRYEFGVKISMATTNRSNRVVDAKSLPGNPHDGHTRKWAWQPVEQLTGQRRERCYVDLGYRGHHVEHTQVVKARQKRGVTSSIRQDSPTAQPCAHAVNLLQFYRWSGAYSLTNQFGS